MLPATVPKLAATLVSTSPPHCLPSPCPLPFHCPEAALQSATLPPPAPGPTLPPICHGPTAAPLLPSTIHVPRATRLALPPRSTAARRFAVPPHVMPATPTYHRRFTTRAATATDLTLLTHVPTSQQAAARATVPHLDRAPSPWLAAAPREFLKGSFADL